MSQIIVLKFGSSVLRTRADLPNVVHEIYRWYRHGHSVVVVVSAIGAGTDQLLGEAREFTAAPEPYATAELLATGERESAALLGIALDRAGIPARVLNPREIGLTALGSPLDSALVSVNTARVRELLVDHPVLVVPGFFGTDSEGRTHVLGRGGSDLTAVYLSKALDAECRLIKDVDGVYESDPASVSRESDAAAGRLRRYVSLDYSTALGVAAPLIQPKAIDFLRLQGSRVQVAGQAKGYETIVHSDGVVLGDAPRAEPLKVLLLGLGTVGFGVYQRLLANAQDFEVIGALVRDRGKFERQGVPGGLLRTRIDQILKHRANVVIDALPGIEPSLNLAQHFLAIGVPVVSANKALIGENGVELSVLARRSGAGLCFSAAVGGAAPMIESVGRAAGARPIASVSGILNGTCNFVLDRLSRGVSLSEAIAEAQRTGFAEHDATEDLSGRDAARKLRILARHAFGAEPRELATESLDELVAERARELRRTGSALRQVARAVISDGEVRGAVRLEEVPAHSRFAELQNEWNALEIATQDGAVHTVTGRGAGRWPTTEAVMADLFDIRRRAMVASAAQK